MGRDKDQVEQAVRAGLEACQVPAGAVVGVTVSDEKVVVALEVDPAKAKAIEPVRRDLEQELSALPDVPPVQVILTAERRAETPLLAGVQNVIAIASGKGGVGKSTVAVNLAVAAARSGLRVGLLDADIYGPSLSVLMGITPEPPPLDPDKKMIPPVAHGVKVMSIGFMVDPDKALVWRGPMVHSALMQMLRDVAWGALDVLFLDMPPGTGDAQLTIAQMGKLTGAVIVSTPQDLALADARRGMAMFRQVNVPVLGVIENMSVYHCPQCGHEAPIFGHGGAQAEAEKLGVSFLGAIPLTLPIRESGDRGAPFALADAGDVFGPIARRVLQRLPGGVG